MMLLLGRQFANLSVSQAYRLYAWANALRETLQNAILSLSEGSNAESWRKVRFELDRVQVQEGSRKEKVAGFTLFSWLRGWSVNRPFAMISEIHTPDHPLRLEYETLAGISLNKLVQANLTRVDSASSWGVRMADIAANIVYSAVQDLDDRKGNVTLYAELMRSSATGSAVGPGLLTPVSEGIPDRVAAKYSLLSEAMKRPR